METKVYEIQNDTLVQTNSLFNNETELYAEANRPQKIELAYSPQSKILSYNSYVIAKKRDYYTKEKSFVTWKLKKQEFKNMK